jgi:hypothetical protein
MGWDDVVKVLVVVGIDEGRGRRGESRVDVYGRDLGKMLHILTRGEVVLTG